MKLTTEEMIALINVLKNTYVVEPYQKTIYNLVRRLEDELDGKTA